MSKWSSVHAAVLLLGLFLMLSAASSVTFRMTNNCGYTVWPGMVSGAGMAPLSTTGFALAHGASATVDAPASWSGRMWARTLCSEDGTGKFICATGECGSGAIQCNGGGAALAVTLVEFKLGRGSGSMDLYEVNLVDGYNLPILVVPQGGRRSDGKCATTGCVVDLNGACPADLKVMAASSTTTAAVACRSACQAFGSPQYCCSGAYGNPNTCRPSTYSQFFKNACPRASSYLYDDAASTFTCSAGTNYAIIFCPRTTSISGKSAGVATTNDTMVVLGAEHEQPSTAILAVLRVMMLVLLLAGLVRLIWLRCSSSNFSQAATANVALAAAQAPQQEASEPVVVVATDIL